MEAEQTPSKRLASSSAWIWTTCCEKMAASPIQIELNLDSSRPLPHKLNQVLINEECMKSIIEGAREHGLPKDYLLFLSTIPRSPHSFC